MRMLIAYAIGFSRHQPLHRLVIFILCLPLVSFAATSPSYATSTPISPPLDVGTRWFVCQGYNNLRITHTGTSALALDLSGPGCDNSASGANVRTPLSGTVHYYGETYGSMCINSKDGRSLSLTHINSDLKAGSQITAQQLVGTIAAPYLRGNAGIPHLHIQMWSTPNCSDESKQIPFDDANLGRICGAPNFTIEGPDNYQNGTWSGTVFTVQHCDDSRHDAGVYHVFAGTTTGKKYEAYWSKGNPTITGNYATLDQSIVDMNFERSNDGYYHTYATTTSGSIYESYWTKGQPMVTGVNVRASEPINASFGTTTSDSFKHLFFATSSGKLYESYWLPGTPGITTGQFADLKAPVADLSFLQSTTGSYHTFIATTSGKVYEARWGGGMPYELHLLTDTKTALTSLDSSIASDGLFHVFIADKKGIVTELSWSNTQQMTTKQLATLGSSVSDINFEYTVDGVNHLYAGTSDGKTHETYWGAGRPLTTDVVLQNIDPVTSIHGLTTEDGIRHVFAGTSTGKVYESYWTPGSGVIISGQFMRVDGQVTSTTFTAT